MSSDLQLLAHRLNRISERHRRSRDFTLNTLRIALREILACFPVYRTYIREGYVSERDRQVVCRAVAQAKRRNPATNAAVFDFIRDVLLLERPPDLDEAGRRERELFVGRLQQVTSPVMAKGIEDTAFYRYFPLASLNEVGGDPARGATSIEEFHRHNLARQAAWPQSLICTTTHDTKRSEDARARINVLSEIPHLWRKAVNRWARLNRRHRREVDGQPAPSRNDEYLFYQSLVGVWPLAPPARQGPRRVGRPHGGLHGEGHPRGEGPHELDQSRFGIRRRGPRVRRRRARRPSQEPLPGGVPPLSRTGRELGPLQRLVANAVEADLAGRARHLSGPRALGFQPGRSGQPPAGGFCRSAERCSRGSERTSAATIGRCSRWPAELAQNPRDPRLKLFVTWRVLQFRRQHADLFQLGDYIPLDVEGAKAKHLCAFARRWPSPSDVGARRLPSSSRRV